MYYFFYFPLGTEGQLRRVPVVTVGLVLILAGAHYLLHYFEPTVVLFDRWVLPTDRPTLAQAFTACFVHAGLFHLFGNLLYLITFGPALEDRIGRAPFLGFYLVTGMISMLVQVEAYRLLQPDGPPVYVLGASGAIAGILGLFAARCWFLRVRVAHATFAFLRATTRGGVTAIPAWAALAVWTVLQGVYALLSLGGEGGHTAYWAHLSGLAVGFLGGAATGHLREGLTERRYVRARRYQRGGDWHAALGELETYRTRGGERSEGLLAEARCLRLLDRRPESLAAYGRGFGLLVEEQRWGEAAAVADESGRVAAGAGLQPEDLRRLAEELEDRGDRCRAAACYERAAWVDPEPARAGWCLERAGEIARLHLGDLDRAADLLAAGAERLRSAEEPDERDQARRLERLSRECLRVLERRERGSLPAG